MSDFGRALDTEVLVEIPKEHFATFEFDPIALAQVDNYNLFTTKLETVIRRAILTPYCLI